MAICETSVQISSWKPISFHSCLFIGVLHLAICDTSVKSSSWTPIFHKLCKHMDLLMNVCSVNHCSHCFKMPIIVLIVFRFKGFSGIPLIEKVVLIKNFNGKNCRQGSQSFVRLERNVNLLFLGFWGLLSCGFDLGCLFSLFWLVLTCQCLHFVVASHYFSLDSGAVFCDLLRPLFSLVFWVTWY